MNIDKINHKFIILDIIIIIKLRFNDNNIITKIKALIKIRIDNYVIKWLYDCNNVYINI